MARFRLLAGQHVTNDTEQEPERWTDPITGKKHERYQEKTYHAGDEIESDVDLAAKHGEAKFERLSGGGPAMHARQQQMRREQELEDDNKRGGFVPEPPRMNPAVAPAGQVSSGKQEATGAKVQRETGTGGKPDHVYHDEAIEPGSADAENALGVGLEDGAQPKGREGEEDDASSGQGGGEEHPQPKKKEGKADEAKPAPLNLTPATPRTGPAAATGPASAPRRQAPAGQPKPTGSTTERHVGRPEQKLGDTKPGEK